MASPQPPPAQAGGSAPPDFIGSIISLTSRADIRYQGRLAQIDPGQATIALEKVRSWGTEGRLASQGRPQDEIAPNDAVYDYIVFRAADVKDLKIDEQNAARPPPPQQGLQDPAILGSSGPPGGQNQFGPPPAGYGPPPGGMYGPQGGYGRPPPPGPGGPGSYGPGGQFGGPPPPGPPSHSPQTQSRPPPQSVKQEPKEKASNTTDKVVDAFANLSVKEQPAGTGSSKGSAPLVNANADSTPRSRNNDQLGQPGRAPRPPRVDRGMYDLPPGPEPLPGADFDFERANAQFEKEKGKVRDGAKASPSPATAHANGAEGTEAAPNGGGDASEGVLLDAIPPADPKSFYDKKSGFFDDISSEVKERHERPGRGRGRGRGGYGGGGREQGQNGGGDHDGPQFRPRGGRGGPGRGRSIRMAEERKNLQTFGDAGGPVPGAGGAYRRGGGPGRGRGRGRGGQNHAQTFA